MTTGIVSALARTVQVPGSGSQAALLADAIQTDASINPGNSGGALVNCNGELVGIPTAGATVPSTSGQATGGSIGLGFAIPVTVAQAVVDQIIATGRVSHASFGLGAVPIAGPAAQRAGVGYGLFVNEVTTGGPADQAGLRDRDVITERDGRPARSVDQLVALTITKRPGDRVTVAYVRQGQPFTSTIVLG